ncbi:GDSL esterase/lipase [Glycine max]|nr:GDSL esterase/lipase [Glycine max]
MVPFIYAAQHLGFPFFSAYINSIGTRSSTIRRQKRIVFEGGTPFTFEIQVAQFNQFKARIGKFFKQEGRNSFREHFPRLEDFAKAIYIFDIGKNDIVAAINRVGQEDSHAVISDIVDYFENQIQVKTPHQFLGLPQGAWFQDGGFEISVLDLGLQISKNSTPVDLNTKFRFGVLPTILNEL